MLLGFRAFLCRSCASHGMPLFISPGAKHDRDDEEDQPRKRQRDEGEDDSEEEKKLPPVPSSPEEYADVARRWYNQHGGAFTSESARRPPASSQLVPVRRNLQVPRPLRRHRHDARHREPHPAPQRHPLWLHQLLQRPPVNEHQLLVHILSLLARQQGTASEEQGSRGLLLLSMSRNDGVETFCMFEVSELERGANGRQVFNAPCGSQKACLTPTSASVWQVATCRVQVFNTPHSA
ncbi:hypothetical protein THAOC_33461 [Thalassiosira oceanica]|uniref:Uncharacterized protein n=1 Tax=Thalassiosira oceanica TaxID=159749 RepID=K0R718_THAOC|nr:hypothetical protein THAOC_33461 [Thalassiosira oceanica]|eukprot:EJK47799.1 hypothetical protein THAOC_33461 [Thalassiosira oceanica]